MKKSFSRNLSSLTIDWSNDFIFIDILWIKSVVLWGAFIKPTSFIGNWSSWIGGDLKMLAAAAFCCSAMQRTLMGKLSPAALECANPGSPGFHRTAVWRRHTHADPLLEQEQSSLFSAWMGRLNSELGEMINQIFWQALCYPPHCLVLRY